MDIPNLHRLRIAIALAILKHKPPNESCYAYILDLRSSFSFVARGTAASIGDLWRDHALKLEKDYAALKTHSEEKQIRSIISPESVLGSKSLKSPQRLKNDINGVKKKGKKKVITDTSDEQLSSHRADTLNEISLKDLCNNLYHADCKNLFVCLDIFHDLTKLIDRPKFPLKNFLSAASRTLDEISVSFDRIVKGVTSFNILGKLETITRLVIEKSLLASFSSDFCASTPEGSCNPFTSLLENLLTRLLISIIRSFFLISSQWLSCLSVLASTDNSLQYGHIDLRPAVLALFQSVLRSLHEWMPPKIAASPGPTSMRLNFPSELYALELALMRHSLILEILRYLEKILLENSGNLESRHTTQSRVMRLVMKDTFWYICSALHTTIALQPEEESLSLYSTIIPDIYKGHHRRLNLLKDAVRNLLVSILIDQESQRSMSSDPFLGPQTPIVHQNIKDPPTVAKASSVHGVSELIFTCNPLKFGQLSQTDTYQNSDAKSAYQSGNHQKALLLDDTERRMLLRIFESYAITN